MVMPKSLVSLWSNGNPSILKALFKVANEENYSFG